MAQRIYAGSVGTPASLGKRGMKGSISGIGEGVYSLILNDDLTISKTSVIASDNAGIITITKDKKYVYAANESKDFYHGLNGSGGGVTAFKVSDNGELVKLNESVSYGSRTSNVAVSDDNRYLVCSNHGSHTTVVCRYVKNESGKFELQRGFDDSSVALFSLNEDGSIGELLDLQVFAGHGYWTNGRGQSTSHLHSVRIVGNLVFAGNRGCDEIEVLKITDNKLQVLNRFKTKKGFAPRHLVKHPFLDILYVVNENYACMSVYSFDRNSGQMEEQQTVQSMDDDYMAINPIPCFTKDEADEDEVSNSAMSDFSKTMPSDIHITSDGKQLFMSNRQMKGAASLACYRVKADGLVEFVGISDLGGRDPRGFNITEDDNYVIVGLCEANVIKVFENDRVTGLLGKCVSCNEVNSVASIVFGK